MPSTKPLAKPTSPKSPNTPTSTPTQPPGPFLHYAPVLSYISLAITILWPLLFSSHYISPALTYLWPLLFSGLYFSRATTSLWPLPFKRLGVCTAWNLMEGSLKVRQWATADIFVHGSL